MLVSLNELGITLGFLLAFLVNYIFMSTQDGWRIMFGLSSGNNQGFGSAKLYLTNLDFENSVKPENSIQFKMSKRKVFAYDSHSIISDLERQKCSLEQETFFLICRI